jgi:hypothetical protein
MVVLMMGNAALAEDQNIGEPVYINGGIGSEEAEDFRAKAHAYNLRLYLSEGKTGHFITDAPLSITDKKGNVRFTSISAGPFLFLQLNNGTYTITAEHNGVTIKRVVKVANHRGVNIYLNWKQTEADIQESLQSE